MSDAEQEAEKQWLGKWKIGSELVVEGETFREFKRLMEKVKEPGCMCKNLEGGNSADNAALNTQERFRSLYCNSLPLFLQIEITNKCNLRCVQCGVINRVESTLPESMFDKLWPVMPHIGGIIWLGGEVFLVDYFMGLLKSINAKYPHINHYIYTNALLLDKKIIASLVGIDGLELKISIDSVVEDTYEQLRSQGKYQILLNNLEMLKEEYSKKGKIPNLSVNVIAMKRNLTQLQLYPDFCKKYGIGSLDISFLADLNPPHTPDADIFDGTDQDVLQKAKRILLDVEAKCREHGIKFYCNFNSYLRTLEESFDERRLYNQTIILESSENDAKCVFQCYYPWTSLYIKCNGLVVPTGDCIIPVGNMITDDFQEIWNGKMMQAYRYKLSRSDLSNWCAYHCRQKVKINKEILKTAGVTR
ncbi:MAG: radical SAM protein [Endomicrobiales bacterium]|nr:radical SAM protein [Endomicrobiales bacterium]